MHGRFMTSALLVFLLTAVTTPLEHSSMVTRLGGWLSPSAEAKSRIGNLLERLRRKNMPEGIAKSNGRIEATQVDVAAKYAGRLADITVEEGSEVKEGQVLGRIASPETEAQLRAAQANVDRAKQAMAEAKSLIVERTSVLVAAKSDCERGARAWLQPLIKAQWARRRGWQHP